MKHTHTHTHTHTKLQNRRKYTLCWLAGQGQFGDVLVGKAYNIVTDAAETLVMLKSLLAADEATQTEFYRELELYSRCHHDNVVRLLGVSRESPPVLAIYDYTELVSRLQLMPPSHFHLLHCR